MPVCIYIHCLSFSCQGLHHSSPKENYWSNKKITSRNQSFGLAMNNLGIATHVSTAAKPLLKWNVNEDRFYCGNVKPGKPPWECLCSSFSVHLVQLLFEFLAYKRNLSQTWIGFYPGVGLRREHTRLPSEHLQKACGSDRTGLQQITNNILIMKRHNGVWI